MTKLVEPRKFKSYAHWYFSLDKDINQCKDTSMLVTLLFGYNEYDFVLVRSFPWVNLAAGKDVL